MPYPLPAVLQPPDVICVQMWIPNEQQYIANFRGHIHELTRWFNHGRDDEQSARIVAYEWMTAFLGMTIGECGEEEMCCDETNDLLGEMLTLWKGGFFLTPNTGQGGGSTNMPECAPDDFGGNPEEPPSDFEFRQRALCYALTNMFTDAIANQFNLLHMKTSAIDALYQATLGVKQAQTPKWQHDTTIYMKSADLDALISDVTDFQSLVCYAYSKWFGQKLTFENFTEGLDGVAFVDPPANLIDRLYFVLFNFLSYSKNFMLFGEALDVAFKQVQADSSLGNDCLCSTPIFCGIESWQDVGQTINYPVCPMIQLDSNTFRIMAVQAPDGYADAWNIHFRWDGVNCFEIQSMEFVFETERHVLSTGLSHSITCDDVLGGVATPDVCYRQVSTTYGSPLGGADPNGARFYADITIKDPCPCGEE